MKQKFLLLTGLILVIGSVFGQRDNAKTDQGYNNNLM